ncbi:purine-binding chemotaxis protein CheW [Sporomusaceae bacterium BoRhaA]|jgi:purine-binding chemotaxis protein CheW|uniref:chemotaxis protein CheW n=1 Tax=Pelorhabdus rhamnosifermentans TaxID=2772457 RepID=UPI001C05EF05|nr:chemotaxis protein CheW [Pelorhabdus rhamnosifermentans]MBU2699977.1 purine-binding chemotaxis protein CheW [Pelorhabdus rhamnosifermentans]
MAEVVGNDLELDDTQKDKFLTFSLGSEVYGIEIRFVTEIIGMQSVTEVPDLPGYVKGIINLRGKIIPVIDVRLRFKKMPREYDSRTCIIVIEIKEVAVGLIVDTVAEVLSIPEQDLASPPKINSSYHQRFTQAIGKVGNDIKLILDCDRLLSDDEMAKLKEESK